MAGLVFSRLSALLIKVTAWAYARAWGMKADHNIAGDAEVDMSNEHHTDGKNAATSVLDPLVIFLLRHVRRWELVINDAESDLAIFGDDAEWPEIYDVIEPIGRGPFRWLAESIAQHLRLKDPGGVYAYADALIRNDEYVGLISADDDSDSVLAAAAVEQQLKRKNDHEFGDLLLKGLWEKFTKFSKLIKLPSSRPQKNNSAPSESASADDSNTNTYSNEVDSSENPKDDETKDAGEDQRGDESQDVGDDQGGDETQGCGEAQKDRDNYDPPESILPRLPDPDDLPPRKPQKPTAEEEDRWRDAWEDRDDWWPQGLVAEKLDLKRRTLSDYRREGGGKTVREGRWKRYGAGDEEEPYVGKDRQGLNWRRRSHRDILYYVPDVNALMQSRDRSTNSASI